MATTNLRYPYNIDGSSDFIRFEFFDYKPALVGGPPTTLLAYNTSATSKGLKRAEKTEPIIITMPNDVSTNFGGNWGGKNLTGLAALVGGTAAATVNAAKGGKFNLSNLTTQGGQYLSGAAGAAAEDILKTMTSKITNAPGMGSNLNTNDVLGLVGTVIVNPNTELLYEGLSLREHGYNFKLIAFSQEEAKVIDEIVKTFKRAVLPKGAGQKFAGLEGRNFIGIPNVCQVSFHQSGGGENKYLPKYKMSAITGVNVDYITEGQYMTFDDGRPIGVNLRVTFKELKLVFSEEIESESVR